MSLVINTNVASLNAQRSLTASGAELKTAMERLSSGKKINSASDDAAGFAIAERMTAQIRGLNMAAKNASDGLSMLATIENATNDITGMLHRMRELAVQGINDTNGTQDRAYLQLEVDALMEEINRVASDTQYNGKSVLNGSLANTVDGSGNITAYGGQIQVGTDANQTVGFGVNSVDTVALSLSAAGTPEDHTTVGKHSLLRGHHKSMFLQRQTLALHLQKSALQSNRLPVIELDMVRCRTVWSTRCLTCSMWLNTPRQQDPE